jgi:KDO2-lipid IV(A) lauroyltransferase
VIGMLPDQVPSGGEGVWADFFNRPAYTMTLPIRLAQATDAPIVWVLAIRTQAGWHLEFVQWRSDQEFVHTPLEEVVSAMNRGLELQIARAPEQYLWAYNRYKVPKGQVLPEVTHD